MIAGKKSAQIREILISESAWEEMTCLFAPSLKETFTGYQIRPVVIEYNHRGRVKSNFAITHEYALWTLPENKDVISRQVEISEEIRRNLRRTGSGSTRAESESQFYGI